MKLGKLIVSGALILTVSMPISQIDVEAKAGYPTTKYKKGAPKKLSNCTQVRKYYPYGITYKHISFQKSHDRDKDKLGCEAKNIKFESWMLKN